MSRDLMRKKRENWVLELCEYTDIWINGEERVIVGTPEGGDEYL